MLTEGAVCGWHHLENSLVYPAYQLPATVDATTILDPRMMSPG